MNDYTKEYRDDFINLIDGLSKEYASFKWWCSSFSEKNIVNHDCLFKILNDDNLKTEKIEKVSIKRFYKLRRRFIIEKFSNKVCLPEIDSKKK